MRQFEVQIKGTVVKTITVEAKDEQEAVELAHEQFTVASTDDQERYNEETLSVKEVV